MHDPFPVASPAWLQKAVTPIAERLSLPTLPFHIHEIIIAFTMYQVIHSYISPFISSRLFPKAYSAFNYRTKLNWDVHVVSLVQSLIVNTTALYLMFYDDERNSWDWAGKIWGYDGASGMLQGLAGGYFIWDLIITIRHIEIFGVGMLLHAISACTVFSLGFRPFLNYYGPVFILYELSSPALNMHWFMDKLQLTGSIYQLLNGIVLITTFFSCRLVWGSLNSIWVFQDIYKAMQHNALTSEGGLGHSSTSFQAEKLAAENGLAGEFNSAMRFAGARSLPSWLALSYLASNIVLNVLNFYWFAKMIQTLRKRFDPPLGTKRPDKEEDKRKLEPEILLQKGVDDDGRKSLEVHEVPVGVRSRRRG